MTEQETAEKKFVLLDILGNQLGETTEFQRLLRLDTMLDQGGDPSSYGTSLKGLQAQKVKNQLKLQAYGVTKILQISFLINKNEFLNNSSHEQSQDGAVVMYQDSNFEKKIDLETGSEEFRKLFDSIQIYGYSLFHSPPANLGIQLLNISNLFQKNNRKEEAVETDIILGYSLMSQRKYIQAAEIFKRSSLFFYKQYEQNSIKKVNIQENQQLMQGYSQQDSSKPLIFSPMQKIEGSDDTFNQSNLFGSTNFQGGGTNNQKLLRAAKLELLVADCIKQPHLQNQKVQSYQRATEYFQGQRININLSQQNADSYTNILILCPYLCKFLLRTLDERIDPLRISAIKGLEFLIDNLGCTISNQLPQILKQVILTYPLIPACSIEPNRQFDDEDDEEEEEEEEHEDIIDRYEEGNFIEIDHEPNEDDEEFGQIRASKRAKKQKKSGGYNNYAKSLQSQASINQRVIFDMYHHLLDQFLNLLASASSQILRSIFNDVISTQLFNNEVAHDVKIYLCKITDKIISICQGDLTVTPTFIQNMMNYLLNSQQQQQFTNQFKQHLERTWDNIKQKLLSNLELTQANRIIDLIAENLQHILDNQGDSGAHPSNRDQQIDQDTEFNFWIEITSIVIQREKRTQENLPSNFARYSKKLEMSQENLNLKLLIHPFLQILELTIAHPQGIETFKLIWTILIEILTSPSAKQQTEYTLSEVAYSILNKTKQFIANHPPPILQLSALIIIISSLPSKELDGALKRELLDLLQIFLGYVPHSIYEETFFLVDCLIDKIDSLDQNLIEKILNALIDQYTMKNKSQKKVVQNFISKIMKQESQTKAINYFTWVLDICLVKNPEPIKEDTFNQMGMGQNEFMVTKNKNQALKGRQNKKNSDSKQFEKQYDIFIDKISFLQDCLEHLKQNHFVALISKNQDSALSESIIKLINSGDSRIRMKGFSIIKKIHEHFVELSEVQVRQLEKVLNNYLNLTFQSKQNQNAPSFQEEWYNSSKNDSDKKSTQNTKNQSKTSSTLYSKYDQSAVLDQINISKQDKDDTDLLKSKKKVFSFSKIMITRLIIACLKASFENLKDPKQQFNSLVLMDQFFQNLFGGPDLESEMKFSHQTMHPSKHQKSQRKVQIIDLETYEFTADQYFDYDNEWYLHMRLNQILKFWPLLQNLVNSPWSNIRSLTYGVICNWVRADLNHYKSSSQKKFLQILFRSLLSLLQSKESECRTGGLNILGSLCGLSYNFDDKIEEMKKYLHFFRRHENLISLAIWETVYDIQSDWDVTNQAAAMIIIQICAPRDSIRHFFRLKQEDVNMRSNFHQFSQNHGYSHMTSKENRSTTPILFQGREDDAIMVNDSGIMMKSIKQSNHQNSQNPFMGNNENTPSRGMYNQIGEDEKQSNIYNNNNISSDSIGADHPPLQSDEDISEANLDRNESQDGDQNTNQDDLFWFDSASEKEIRDMISMFKGEQKPPVTLWIERDTYNTEHKPEGTTITEVVTYTMNEEEDAGVYGYFDEVGLNQNNGNNSNNNQANNHSSITEEYIQQQQQQFQQMKKANNKGLDFLQERGKEIKLFTKQEGNVVVLEQFGQSRVEQGTRQVPQQTATNQAQSNSNNKDESKQNKQKFNKFDDEDLDYDKLGIINLEEDEPFIEDYEKTYQEYKKQKNPSQALNQKGIQDGNRPITSKVPQRNSSSKQQSQNEQVNDESKKEKNDSNSKQEDSKRYQQLEKLENNPKLTHSSGKGNNQNSNDIQDSKLYAQSAIYDQKNNQFDDPSYIDKSKKTDSKQEESSGKKQGDTLKMYKQSYEESHSYQQPPKRQNQHVYVEYDEQQIINDEFDMDDNDIDDYDEDDQEEIEEDIYEEDDNESPNKNKLNKDDNFAELKYETFTKISHPGKMQQVQQQKKDNSRYVQSYGTTNEKNISSQQSSQQQNSSGKRLKEDLQSFANSANSAGGDADPQKQLFNQRMHFREAILSDENKESLSYTQSSQPNQRRRDTFEVTLSFSDSSIFRDENTDKTLTKEDEPNNLQQQLFNNKFSDNQNNVNFIITDAAQKLTPSNLKNQNNRQGMNQIGNNVENLEIQQQQPKKQQQQQAGKNDHNKQQTQINNFFINQSASQNQQQNLNDSQAIGKKNQQQNNIVSMAKSPSPNNLTRNAKTPPLQKQNNENQNSLNRTSPIPNSNQKSQEKPSLPPNNTPRVNQASKSPVNINTNENNPPKSKTPPLTQNIQNNQLQKPNLNEQNNSGKKIKGNNNNISSSPQERGNVLQQQSPYRQQMQQTIEKQRSNYHHSGGNFDSSDNTQMQLLNALHQQLLNQHNKSSQGGSKSPSSTTNQQRQSKKSPSNNANTNNLLLNHLLKNPTSTKNQSGEGSDEKNAKQKSKSRSKEKNQQNSLQKYQNFQNNLELNILQGQEFVVASSTSSKSQGRSQKVDFFKKNAPYQTISSSHSPYQTVNNTIGGSSSTKNQKSASKSRSKSNGKKKNGLKTSSVTPSGFFKNRTPSQSPPTSTGKNTANQLRLQGSNSGGKSRSFEKNNSSNFSSTFNNTISSMMNGLNNNSTMNQNKPPLKTSSASAGCGSSSQNTNSHTANKNNLNLHSIDKLYKTDFLSRLLDSTKSNVSSKKTTNITPKSCKTKVSSSRNSRSKDNNSTLQYNNNQSYYSNQNNQNSQTINSQSYNNISNSNFSFAGHPQREGHSPQQSAQFDDDVHQQFSYDETVYGNAGGNDSKNCTLDLADAFQNIESTSKHPLKQQQINNNFSPPTNIVYNNYMAEQSQQQALLAQIAMSNNQQMNKLQGIAVQQQILQNIPFSANTQTRSSRRGSEGSCLPFQNNIEIHQNNSFHHQQPPPIQQNFIITHQQQQMVLQNQFKPGKGGGANKENFFENSTDELLDVLTKQRNQRNSNSSKQKKRSTSGGKSSGNQSSTTPKSTKSSQNSANRAKLMNSSYQGSDKPNKFEPYKQPSSPNRKKKISPNTRPQSSTNQSFVQQINQPQLSTSTFMNTHHFSSTSQDSTSLQSQLKNTFHQTSIHQSSHNNSFQSYNKPPLVKKQQQNNSKEKESNLQNSGLFGASLTNTPNSHHNSHNNPIFLQQNNQIPTRQRKKIQFDQSHSFDESLINTTL